MCLLLLLSLTLQLYHLLSSRVKDFTSFYSRRKRKNSPLKENADGIHYSLYDFPFLKYSNYFSSSPSPRYDLLHLQHHDLLFTSGSGFLAKTCSAHAFLSPLILHSPHVFRSFSILSEV